MRQAGRAEHQAQTERDGGDRVGEQAARVHQLVLQLMNSGRLLEQVLVREVELAESKEHHQRATGEQHAGLDDLHPGRGNHAAKGDVHHHQDADSKDGDVVLKTEEQLDQLAGTDHLGDQIEADDGQRRDRGHRAHLALVEAVGGNVGEGELAQVAQAFGHQEQDDRPAGEEGQHVDVAVVALGIDHGGQTEQRGRRHVVAGNGQAILETGDAAAGRVEVSGSTWCAKPPSR